MAIQLRRGIFSRFDPTKLLPGEVAVVTSGDPSTADGRSVYVCFSAGTVKRLIAYEDIATEIANALEDLEDDFAEAVTAATESATAAAASATSAASAATSAAEAANVVVASMPDLVEQLLVVHPEWTTTVQDGAVTDAKLYQGKGGILARNARLMYRLDNLLANALPEGDSATATDAAKTPPAGLSLYGRSTQDGTPTPSAPVSIVSVGGNLLPNNGSSQTVSGITFTVNADGSVTCSGTATATTHFNIVNGRGTEKLRLPDGTYTLWAWQDGYGVSNIYLSLMKNSAYVAQDVLKVVNSNGCSVAAIEGYDYDAIHVGFFITAGATVNATIRFALFAGDQSARAAYVPYGSVGLWAQGANVAHPLPGTVSRVGLTVTVDDDGWITVSGTSTATASQLISIGIGTTDTSARVIDGAPVFSLYMENDGALVSGEVELQVYGSDGEATNRGIYATASQTIDVLTDYISRIFVFVRPASNGKTYSGRFRFSLVRGNQMPTEYIPYVETVTPIDLDGHELRSLPDGTRDELTVGADGRVTLVQRVGTATVSAVSWLSQGSIAYAALAGVRSGYFTDAVMSDHFGGGTGDGLCRVSGGNVLFVSSLFSDAATANAWFAANPTEVTYPLATPQTIDLGWTDAIPLCGPDLTAQAVPSAPFALTYERDLNVTLARLEAALAALA